MNNRPATEVLHPDSLAVIVPARNEAENVLGVIEDIHIHLPGAQIVVVDDHSQDGTADLAERIKGVIVLRSPICLGIGGAVQLGIKFGLEKGFTRFGRMDGDGQHRAASLVPMLKALGPRTLIQGSRAHSEFLATSNWVRKLGSLYFHLLFRLFTKKQILDPTSGLMCFGKDIAQRFSNFYPTDFPEIESLVLLLRADHRILSMVVPMDSRASGASSIGPWKGLLYMFTVSVAFLVSFVRKNPYAAVHVG